MQNATVQIDMLWLVLLGGAFGCALFWAIAVRSRHDAKRIRQLEADLRATEERLAGLLLSIPDYMAISTAADGRLIEVNRGFEELTGWAKEEAIGCTSIELGMISSRQRADAYALLQQSNGVIKNVPIDLQRKDGTVRHTLFSFSVFDVSGVANMVAIGRDITEMKEQELILRATEERLACMFRAIPELVTVSTLMDGRLVDVNKGFEEMTGWAREEVIGRTSIELGYLSAETRERGFVALKQYGALKDFAVDIQAKNGAIRHTLMSCAVFDAGGQTYLVTVSRDVTELRNKEEALRIADIARKAAETEALEAQAETIKAQKETLRAQNEKMESLTQLVTNVAHEINTPIGSIKSSGNFVATELNEVTAQTLHLSNLLDGAQRDLFVQLIGHAKKPMGSLSSREERAMRRTVAQRLGAAKVDSVERKANVLVSLHAHDSPLDYLSLLNHPQCEAILATASSIAAILNGTHNIGIAVDRVSKIVTTLKTFAQVGNSGEMTIFPLQDGIEFVLAIYHSQLRSGVKVIRLYDDLPSVKGYAEELRQVWTHLIHNALQAMAYRGTLTIALRCVGDKAMVSIADTGTGIPEDVLPRIFEPFFSTRPQGEGGGLGLSVLKKIVEKHNGQIDVKTKVGVGSTFSVYLPLSSVA